MEKVSVVLPCYNHGNYVADAINSVLNQTYSNFELFIFDNGSADNSWDVIQKFKDSRIKKIRFQENDLLKVKKQFIEMASGKYFAIMHSDDVWKEQKLEKQMALLTQNEDARVCFTWSKFVDEDLNDIEGLEEFFHEYNKTQQEWWKTFMSRANHLSCPSFICERDIYIKYFGKLYPYRQIADFYCWMKILEETNLYIVEEVLVNQRVHNSGKNKNESYRSTENLTRENIELKYIIYKIIDEMDDEVFVKYFCKSKEDQSQLKHIDVMCEKFMFFVHRNRGFLGEYDNAIRYYDTYFEYVEDGKVFYQYLNDKYNFSRNDFFTYTGGEKYTGGIIESRNHRWAKMENIDFSTVKYPVSLSIYGCGQIGKVFYKKIKDYCKVEQFIDGQPRADVYGDVQIVTVDQAVLNENSVIVVVPTYDFELIVEKIKNSHPYVCDDNIIKFDDFIGTGKIIDPEF